MSTRSVGQAPASTRRRAMMLFSALAMLVAMTFAVNVNAPAADARSSTCTGAASTSKHLAKTKYFVGCGMIWSASSGKHRCDWSTSDGWSCSGPRDTSRQQYCHGALHVQSIDVAKDHYRINCAQRWQAGSGEHHCRYFSHRNSWICSGPSNR